MAGGNASMADWDPNEAPRTRVILVDFHVLAGPRCMPAETRRQLSNRDLQYFGGQNPTVAPARGGPPAVDDSSASSSASAITEFAPEPYFVMATDPVRGLVRAENLVHVMRPGSIR